MNREVLNSFYNEMQKEAGVGGFIRSMFRRRPAPVRTSEGKIPMLSGGTNNRGMPHFEPQDTTYRLGVRRQELAEHFAKKRPQPVRKAIKKTVDRSILYGGALVAAPAIAYGAYPRINTPGR